MDTSRGEAGPGYRETTSELSNPTRRNRKAGMTSRMQGLRWDFTSGFPGPHRTPAEIDTTMARSARVYNYSDNASGLTTCACGSSS